MKRRMQTMKSINHLTVTLGLSCALLAAPLASPLAAYATSAGAISHEIVLKRLEAAMTLNGQPVPAAQPLTIKNGVSYAPLSTLANLYGFQVSYNSATKEAVIRSSDELIIRAQAGTNEINVNDTAVLAAGDLFTQQGSMMIPLRTWASVTGSALKVSDSEIALSWKAAAEAKPEEPSESQIAPTANFTTDKSLYRIGEPVLYTNLSSSNSDDNVASTVWSGNELGFFEAGEHTITLTVTNSNGLSDTISKTIQVSSEQMYSQSNFQKLFMPVGDKINVDAAFAFEHASLPYRVETEAMTFVRSNSPEHLYGEEGILYQDNLSGKFRINIHNQNRSSQDLGVYLLATNNGQHDASIDVNALGVGGPTKYVSTSGKLAVSRFLTSKENNSKVATVNVPAGESVIVLPEMNKMNLKAGLTMTTYAELTASEQLQFSVVTLNPDSNPISALPELRILDRDGKHVRGTFAEGNRKLVFDETLGYAPQRVVIGDRTTDPFVEGADNTSGAPETNIGNTGVLYRMHVKVAPHTLISLNARGGHYAGAFVVNGKTVNTTDNSILINQGESAVLHRTGATEETVEITFVPASGSNLPIYMLFSPLPKTLD
ncbi:copper amine oxidase N-terminal domain-containing protein [Paenibacillaceae bacterium]|nr:copper amine oxidase N-terminal domain-containing protein [Paenibacillaceae bacterium]